MSKYTSIKSLYIKNLISMTSWQNHKIIDNLISLYNYILDSPKSWAESMSYHFLRAQYPEAYLDLLREVSPERYQIEFRNHVDEMKRNQVFCQEKLFEEQALFNDWCSAQIAILEQKNE